MSLTSTKAIYQDVSLLLSSRWIVNRVTSRHVTDIFTYLLKRHPILILALAFLRKTYQIKSNFGLSSRQPNIFTRNRFVFFGHYVYSISSRRSDVNVILSASKYSYSLMEFGKFSHKNATLAFVHSYPNLVCKDFFPTTGGLWWLKEKTFPPSGG